MVATSTGCSSASARSSGATPGARRRELLAMSQAVMEDKSQTHSTRSLGVLHVFALCICSFEQQKLVLVALDFIGRP